MIYDLDTPLLFGKHRGRTVEELLDEAPGYLVWALENVDDFEVDKALQDEIMHCARRAKRR
jgi:hypothetical protein